MPLYEYEAFDEETKESLGERQHILAVNDRDAPPPESGVTLIRRAFPSRLGLVGSRVPEHVRSNDSMLKICHRMEQRQGNTSDFYRRMEYHPEVIKRCFGNNPPPEAKFNDE